MLSSGTIKLDLALGGGFPSGLSLVYGGESCKSGLALLTAAVASSIGQLVLLVDSRRSLDIPFAKRVGVDVDSVLLSLPRCCEEAFDVIYSTIGVDQEVCVVIDSINSLSPLAYLKGHIKERTMLLSRCLDTLRDMTAVRDDVHVIMTSDVRDGSSFSYAPDTRACEALLHSSCHTVVRLGDRSGGDSDSMIDATVEECVEIAPGKTTRLHYSQGVGIDKVADMIEVASYCGVIDRKGSWYSYGGSSVQGIQEMIGRIWAEELYDEIEKKVLDIVRTR